MNYETARNYAISMHNYTNCRYDGHNYEFHLEMVDKVARKHLHLSPVDEDVILSACWCHDLIEDCRETYNDVKRNTIEQVADIVYAVTNEKGRNRKERQNERYYRGIVNTPGALFVKLCDRLANIKYSVYTKGMMLKVYRDEHDEFVESLYDERYKEMFDEMRRLLEPVEV